MRMEEALYPGNSMETNARPSFYHAAYRVYILLVLFQFVLFRSLLFMLNNSQNIPLVYVIVANFISLSGSVHVLEIYFQTS